MPFRGKRTSWSADILQNGDRHMSYTLEELKKARKFLFKQVMIAQNVPLEIQERAKIDEDKLSYTLHDGQKFEYEIGPYMIKGLYMQMDGDGKLMHDLEKYYDALREVVLGGLYCPVDMRDTLELIESSVDQRVVAFHKAYGQ